jgi:hypothetical protein
MTFIRTIAVEVSMPLQWRTRLQSPGMPGTEGKQGDMKDYATV